MPTMASPKLIVLAATALAGGLLIPGAAYADSTYVCTPTAVAIGGTNTASNTAAGGGPAGGAGGAGGDASDLFPGGDGGAGGNASETDVAASSQESNASATADCGPGPTTPVEPPAPIVVTPAPSPGLTFINPPSINRYYSTPGRFYSSSGTLPRGGANTGSE